MSKKILLATFIFPERTDWFISYLEQKFEIKKEQVFCYKNLDDESKLIFTFRLQLPEGKRLDFKNLFPNAIIIHKKGETLYTINALNRLIETQLSENIGNIDYKQYKIDWAEYQNKFILIDNDELTFFNINRVF